MWLYVMPLWLLKILIQNGWQATGQRDEQQQTAKRTHRHKDYLLISSISHNSVWWSVAAERQSGRWISAQTYLSAAEEETEVL